MESRRPLSPTPLAWAAEPADAEALPPETVFRAGLQLHHLANTAYPIGHRQTIWSYRRPAAEHAALLEASLGGDEPMGLYAHIPFCQRRCAFCEYTVLPSHSEELEARYQQALEGELALTLRLLGAGRKRLVGFDIGGGTPGLIAPARVGALVAAVRSGFLLEPGFAISIETTPSLAARHLDRLQAYRSFGIERISMGLQVASSRLLAHYGREQPLHHNQRAVENVRRAGFRTLNLDLMYGLLRQGEDDLRASLEHAVALDPEVITLYRMRYKGTRIAAEGAGVDRERVVAEQELAHGLLAAAGYHANPGKNAFSRDPADPGTSAYLTARVGRGTPYLGLGLGAQTFTGTLLGYNQGAASKRLEPYLRAVAEGRPPLQDLYWLPRSEGMAKMIAVSFYFGEIDRRAFELRFGLPLEACFPEEVRFLVRHRLMEARDGRLSLTHRGARVLNGVIALFYSPRVKAHLLSLAEASRRRAA